MSQVPIDFWNVFHDGAITAVEEKVGTVRLFISIGYLRRRLSPFGGGFVVTLNDVTSIEFKHFNGEAATVSAALEDGEPQILSTDSESFPVTVHTTLGQIIASYGGVKFELDTGQALTFDDVARVATEYWDEFEMHRSQLQSE